MKKLIVLALLIVGTTMVAQERNRMRQGNKMEQFTPEQRSQLMLKKMTLALDLNDSQQKEIGSMIAEKMAKGEAMKKDMLAKRESGVLPTSDERFAMASKMLDEQIANKKRMEKILNPKQFEKWSSLREEHQRKHKKGPQRNKMGEHQGKRQN